MVYIKCGLNVLTTDWITCTFIQYSKFNKMTSLGSNGINLLLVGRSRSGISSTWNSLLGRENHCTMSEKEMRTGCKETNGNTYNFVDMPGFQMCAEDNAGNIHILDEALKLCPGGFHAILLIMSFIGRFTDEDVRFLKMLKARLGDKFVRDRCVAVFTHGDNFDTEMSEEVEPVSFIDWCRRQTGPEQLVKLFQKCQNRIVLFYNKGKNYQEKRQKSVRELLDLVFKNVLTGEKLLELKRQEIVRRILSIGIKLSGTSCASNLTGHDFNDILLEVKQLLLDIDSSGQGHSELLDLRQLVMTVNNDINYLATLNYSDRLTTKNRICDTIFMDADPKAYAWRTIFS
ncbi:GTPase IMAP family member 7 [Biomphalaria glabrata]|nr:GTPase IMAP family member 7 [Biomphalaria glabrata]